MENIILWWCSEHAQPNLMGTKRLGFFCLFVCFKLRDVIWKPPVTEIRNLYGNLTSSKMGRILVYFRYEHLDLVTVSSWRRRWHPTPVLLPGKSHGRRSLVGCSPWGGEESGTTEWLHFHFSLSCFGEGNGNPFQCSCLENPRGRGAWWAAVYGVAQSRTRLKRLSSSSIVSSCGDCDEQQSDGEEVSKSRMAWTSHAEWLNIHLFMLLVQHSNIATSHVS